MSDDSSGRETEGDGPDELPPDHSFSLLSSERRRCAIRLLERHGDVALPDIAEVATVELTGREITDVSPEEVRDTYMLLYHSDVPKLEEAAVITYDQESDVVAPGRRFDRVAELLDTYSTEP